MVRERGREHLPRSLDARLRRRFPRNHASLRHRHSAGATAAQRSRRDTFGGFIALTDPDAIARPISVITCYIPAVRADIAEEGYDGGKDRRVFVRGGAL